jgi:hypothetical protein
MLNWLSQSLELTHTADNQKNQAKKGAELAKIGNYFLVASFNGD